MKQQYKGKGPKRKDKTTAVLLAVFLSSWTWVYTYRENAWKFWLGICLSVLLVWTLVAPIGVWIWAIIDTATKEREWYEQYYK